MSSYKYNPNNTEGAYPTSIDFIDAEIKKGDKIVATDLVDLYDTEITNPVDGELLVYESGSLLWKNGGSSGGGESCESFNGHDEEIIDQIQFDIIDAGGIHTGGIKSDGTLWGTGRNYYGALGVSDNADRPLFTQESSLSTNWIYTSGGLYYRLAIKSDGTLWSSGYNYYGQLGIGHNSNRNVFTQEISLSTDWVIVSCGIGYNSLAIKDDGGGNRTLWATGLNNNGQLGLGDNNNRDEFIQVGTDTDWQHVDCHGGHSLAIKTNGELWGTGSNTSGQLGLGHTSPIDEFTKIGIDTDWVSFKSIGSHSMAIKSDGTLWATGDNDYGQLGLGDIGSGTERNVFTKVGTDTDWDIIFGGVYHSLAIKDDGGGNRTLWSTGRNLYGELGFGNFGAGTEKSVFTQVGTDTDWKQVAGGYYFSVAIKTDGTSWNSGWNAYGQLGLDNSNVNVYVFTNIIFITEIHGFVFIDENTLSTERDGTSINPFISMKECFEWLNGCKTITDEDGVIVKLLSDLTITEETSLNHPQGRNITIDCDNYTITNVYNIDFIVGEVVGADTNLLLSNNHAIKIIENATMELDLTYTTYPYTIVSEVIYVNGNPITDYTYNEYNVDINNIMVLNISSINAYNITITDTDSEIIVKEIVPDIEYAVIYIDKNSIYNKSKSILNMDTTTLDGIKADAATITANDITSGVEWDLVNDSTLIINQTPTVAPTINNENSTYIIDGVQQ